MAYLMVSTTGLRGAADRIEGAAAELGGIRDRLDGSDLPPRPGPIDLLARRHGELHAAHTDALAALAGQLRDDAAKLRTAADRYEDTECQNTISHQ
jgi:hypothetical protein